VKVMIALPFTPGLVGDAALRLGFLAGDGLSFIRRLQLPAVDRRDNDGDQRYDREKTDTDERRLGGPALRPTPGSFDAADRPCQDRLAFEKATQVVGEGQGGDVAPAGLL